MINIKNYLDDGANWQAQAVLAFLRYYSKNVTYSEDEKEKIEICVGRYENCREQGYIFTLYYNYTVVMNYCVYEHRNSDSLCVQIFKTVCNLNTPGIDEVWKEKKDKWDVDKMFPNGQIVECGEFIFSHMKSELEKIKKDKNNV